MNNTVKILKFAKGLLGQQGPIVINTRIAAFYERLPNAIPEDNIILGKDGTQITHDDIYEFVNDLHNREVYVFENTQFDEWYVHKYILGGEREFSIDLNCYEVREVDNPSYKYEIIWG